MPWNIDADTVTINDDWAGIALVKNSNIENFLEPDGNDKQFFIVAPKGYGKTLLLKNKSYIYRINRKADYFIPKKELCEKLTIQNTTFSIEDLNKFKNLSHWIELWHMSLIIFILKNLDIDMSDRIKKLVGDASRLSHILNIFLRDRSNFYKNIDLIHSELAPKIEKIEKSIAIFIDNIDEAFDNHIGERYLEYKIKEVLDSDVWINSQLGFVEAVKQINSWNKHIKIFASIRSEAFNLNPCATALQMKSYSTVLSYGYFELKSIFEKNIELMKDIDLVNPDSNNLYKRFVGTDYIPHEFITEKDGQPVSESIFDYIYRHTFRRPREIVYLGKMLLSLERDKRTELNRFRECINSASCELFNQYKKEFIPFFDENKFENFCRKIKANVLSRQQAERAYNLLRKHYDALNKPYGHIFSYYYNCGMIGYVEEYNGKCRQIFLDVAHQLEKEGDKIPNSHYYLLHPAIHDTVRKYHQEFKWDTKNVIGYDKNFIIAKKHSINRHIHFGAGKLGLGFVVPMLLANKHTSVAVIQRASDNWKDLIKADGTVDEIIINATEYPPYKFILLTDNSTEAKWKNSLKRWENGENVFILSNNKDKIKTFMLKAVTYTTALGPGLVELEKYFSLINSNNCAVVLPFENDAEVVNRLSETLKSKNKNKVSIATVIADRICKDVKIIDNIVNVNCEKDFKGVAVALNEGLSYDLKETLDYLFDGINQIKIIERKEEFDFYYRKKFYLVNGIHMIIAILGYFRLLELNLLNKKHDLPITFIIENKSLSNIIKHFCNLEILQVIFNTQDDLLKSIYGDDIKVEEIFEKLAKESKKYLDRFINSADSLNRILDLNKPLMEKYKQRIDCLSEFVKNNESKLKAVNIRSKPSIATIYKNLNDLQRKFAKVLIYLLQNKTP